VDWFLLFQHGAGGDTGTIEEGRELKQLFPVRGRMWPPDAEVAASSHLGLRNMKELIGASSAPRAFQCFSEKEREWNRWPQHRHIKACCKERRKLKFRLHDAGQKKLSSEVLWRLSQRTSACGIWPFRQFLWFAMDERHGMILNRTHDNGDVTVWKSTLVSRKVPNDNLIKKSMINEVSTQLVRMPSQGTPTFFF
jgi:hypothetical protein